MAYYGSKYIDDIDVPNQPTKGVKVTLPHFKRDGALAVILSALYLRFTATWKVTGGTGAGAIYSDALARFLRLFTIKMNGATLWAVSAQNLLRLLEFWSPTTYVQDHPTSLAAGTSEDVELLLELPFYMPHSKVPDASALPVPFGRDHGFLLETGVPSDAATAAADATRIELENANIEVTAVPLEGDRPWSDEYDVPIIQTYEIPVTTAKDGLRIPLDAELPGTELRAVMIVAEHRGSGGAHYEPTDAVVERFALEMGGVDLYEPTPWKVQQQRNKKVYQLPALKTGVVLVDAAEGRETSVGQLWPQVGLPEVIVKCVPGDGDTRIVLVTYSVLR